MRIFTLCSVMLALGQTSAVTMGLSMYALSRPKHDLSTLGSLCGTRGGVVGLGANQLIPTYVLSSAVVL